MGARLVDYTDSEFLHVINDVADVDGWASTIEIADQLGISGNGVKHPAHNVGQRCAWMKFYGFLEGHPKDRGFWRISKRGLVFLNGKLPASQRRALESLEAASSVEVLHLIGTRFIAGQRDPLTRAALRREFQYHDFRGARMRPSASANGNGKKKG